jgi:hypothetical protein
MAFSWAVEREQPTEKATGEKLKAELARESGEKRETKATSIGLERPWGRDEQA